MNANRRNFLLGAGTSVIAAANATTVRAGDSKTKQTTRRPSSSDPRLFLPGTVTYNIAKDWDLDTLLANCEKVGFCAVELRTTHKHGVEPDLPSEKRKEVRKRFEQSPVTLFGLGTTCEFHSPDADVVKKNIEQAGEFLKLAHDVGAVGIKVRPNGLNVNKGIPADVTLKQIGQALTECGKLAEPLGIEVWVEVHGRETSKPEHMHQIMSACGHPSVGVTWNSNDSDVQDGSINNAFNLLGPYIRCVHLRDLFVDYPFAELFMRLRRQGYDRYTMAEIPESSDPDRVLRYFVRLWDALSAPVALSASSEPR